MCCNFKFDSPPLYFDGAINAPSKSNGEVEKVICFVQNSTGNLLKKKHNEKPKKEVFKGLFGSGCPETAHRGTVPQGLMTQNLVVEEVQGATVKNFGLQTI